ncbi:unnamed protein product [Gongylonema pulchrum]|uniref:Kinesin motor domain-containing protein n=1 Tax=Gongylonema pulchrum TaxID=637853 RepID=A0A183EE95_9BILA|nr:unnamed protein product [Gongylonema pulchrum]
MSLSKPSLQTVANSLSASQLQQQQQKPNVQVTLRNANPADALRPGSDSRKIVTITTGLMDDAREFEGFSFFVDKRFRNLSGAKKLSYFREFCPKKEKNSTGSDSRKIVTITTGLMDDDITRNLRISCFSPINDYII